MLALYFELRDGEPSTVSAVLKSARFWPEQPENGVWSGFKRLPRMLPPPWHEHLRPFVALGHDESSPEGEEHRRAVVLSGEARERIVVLPDNELDEIRRWVLPRNDRAHASAAVRLPAATPELSPVRTVAQVQAGEAQEGREAGGSDGVGLLRELRSFGELDFNAQPAVYVKRTREEDQVLARIREGEPWVPLEGDAGTGKTTLLHELKSRLAAEAGERKIPLLVDASWLLSPLASTPFGELAERVGARDLGSAWELLRLLGTQVARTGKQLVVLFDTLDAVLLTGARERTILWLAGLRGSGIQVVSSCRPLEAQQAGLPPARRAVALCDFTDEQAWEAIRRYVDVCYAGQPAGVRDALRDRLRRHYLEQAPYADICRRPVTLRMLFEAYGDRFPPERLNRAQLFGDFWEKKVRGLGAPDRGRAASPVGRDRLAMAVALAMCEGAKPRLWLAGIEVDRLLTEQGVSWAEYDALLSEGVLKAVGHGHVPEQVGFFHQSFLEHAAARAILRIPDATERSRRLDECLAALGSNDGAPWFALLEELALQAAGTPDSDRVCAALMESKAVGALLSAGAVWCRLPKSTAEVHRATGMKLAADAVASRACLAHLHDAPADRIDDLLEEFAAPAWASAELNMRFTALEAWTRAALLYPRAVHAQITALKVVDAALMDEKGHLMSRVASLLAAFLGAEDRLADSTISDFYAALAEKPSARSRITLVDAVASRTYVARSALGLLEHWLEVEEPHDLKEARTFHEAFGAALGRHGADEARRARERELVLARGEKGLRVLSVWRERIRNGIWTISNAPVALDDPRAVDVGLWAEIVEVVLAPLAGAEHVDALDALLSSLALVPRSPEKDHQDPVRELTIRALVKIALSPEQMLRALDASRVDRVPTTDLSDQERRLLARCLVAIPDRAEGILDDLARQGALLDVLDSVPAGPIAERLALRLAQGSEPLSSVHATRVARYLEQALMSVDHRSGPALAEMAREWFLRQLAAYASEPRKVALRALPLTVRELDAESLVSQLATKWPNKKTDGESNAVAQCLLKIATDNKLSGGATAELLQLARSMVLGAPRSLEATRRTAFALLSLLADPEAESLHGDVEEFVTALEGGSFEGTNDIVGTLELAHVLAPAVPVFACSVLMRVAKVAEDAKIGRHGWDSFKDASRRAIRVILGDAEATSLLCEHLGSLPEHVQAAVVECAQQTGSEAAFARLRGLDADGRLGGAARQKLHALARRPVGR